MTIKYMDTPERRYRRDPQFRQLVDQLEAFLQQAKYSPTEMREAVLLASIHYEFYSVRNLFTDENTAHPATTQGPSGEVD